MLLKKNNTIIFNVHQQDTWSDEQRGKPASRKGLQTVGWDASRM